MIMWYENNYRRHLCDMHIDDWNDEFLSQFSPEEYFDNLKIANVTSAMLYAQSHAGLCYYPTENGKIHNAFIGREDMMKQLVDMCRKDGIAVTIYYSFIFNSWAANTHPEWRIVSPAAVEKRAIGETFSSADVSRYGTCCPNNKEYIKFTLDQVDEICDYFDFDGMFFDMLFWPDLCHCSECQQRFKDETGYDLPTKEDYNDPVWLLHMQKRREWIGGFAQMLADRVKSHVPTASVEHNVAYAALPDAKKGLAEDVLNASDYAGGDIASSIYHQSYTCKFYRNITKNQPFEFMPSRCEPNLSMHTIPKSEDRLLSQVFLSSAHHGATLMIDAIDPVGTLDRRFYERLGKVFERTQPYEKYFSGEMIEDIGIYYTLRSKFNAHGEVHTNNSACVNTTATMIKKNITCGITGGYHDISDYKILVASCLTEEDKYDYERIIEYVGNGGCLYISGGDCHGLIKEFFGGKIVGRTRERVVYIAPKPNSELSTAFGWFNEKYPLHFNGTAPIAEGISDESVIATLTLPYTLQGTSAYASIHSDPPGIRTTHPAMAYTTYGKGKVLWSALPIEAIETPYHLGDIFVELLQTAFNLNRTVTSDAPEDVEVIAFRDENCVTISSVQYCTGAVARHIEPFTVTVTSEIPPKQLLQLPDETNCDFEYVDGRIRYTVDNLNIFDMKKIIF